MVNLKILENRKQWLETRSCRIGGSDASAIIGLNPYKSNLDLWLEKTGQKKQVDISDESYVKYGTEAEEHLRSLFALDFPEYVVEYKENNIFLNDRYPFAHASLDGWLFEKGSNRRGILEIKTTNILRSMQKEQWNDRIPDNYYAQILHYLMVTEFEFVVLKAQMKTQFSNGNIYLQTKHYHVERSEVEDDILYLAEQERKFWDMVQNKERPALLLPAI